MFLRGRLQYGDSGNENLFRRKLDCNVDNKNSKRTISKTFHDSYVNTYSYVTQSDSYFKPWFLCSLCIVPYIRYFVQRIKWPGYENLLKDFIRKMAWEKRFGFFQPKMKSKPTTLISGSCVSKRAKIPCHILRFALHFLLSFGTWTAPNVLLNGQQNIPYRTYVFMPMVTALPFFSTFFIANFCLFCQKGKSSVLNSLIAIYSHPQNQDKIVKHVASSKLIDKSLFLH